MASPTGITATDRKALAKITEGRYEVIEQQLNARKREIEEIARQQIIDEHQAEIDNTWQKLRDIDDRKAKLEAEHDEKVRLLDREQEDVEREAEKKGLRIARNYSSGRTIVPKDIDQKIKEKFKSIFKDYDTARYGLRTMKLQTLEKVHVAGLKSEAAVNFLGDLPDVDDLLPAPENIPQLQQPSES